MVHCELCTKNPRKSEIMTGINIRSSVSSYTSFPAYFLVVGVLRTPKHVQFLDFSRSDDTKIIVPFQQYDKSVECEKSQFVSKGE